MISSSHVKAIFAANCELITGFEKKIQATLPHLLRLQYHGS